MIRHLLIALALALGVTASARAAPVRSGHVTSELIAQDAAAVPGATVYVALRQSIQSGWHTYWRNPGDSGTATAMTWTLPTGWSAGDIVWATPERISTGPADNPIRNYVYSGDVILPIPLTVPANAQPGTTVTLRAGVAYLVCADVCVPESATLTLFVPVAAAASGPDPRWGAPIARAIAAAPKPSGLAATFQPTRGALTIGITGVRLAGADFTGADFYAYDAHALAPAAPAAIERGPQGLALTLTPQEGVDPASVHADIAGILVLRSGAYEVTAHPGAIAPGARGLGPVARTSPGGGGLLLNAALAFLGGLILNLMPCVFPVLSMKAASLAGHGQEARGARLQGIVFLLGVVATFLVLAGLLIAARAGGEAVGWGFQLQEPRVIAVLALIVMAVGLNLSGVFEMGLSVQGAGQSLASRGGLLGAFFTGALAVVVAAPCTAPFMATAVGFAATQPPVAALTVFAALALGFAAPFTALSFAPWLWRRLPRPGVWMERLRQVLAFPMYGAAGWLVWVLAQQAGSTGLARVLAALLALSFAAWLFGLTQKGGRWRVALTALAGIAAAGAFVGAVWPAYPAAPAAQAAHTDIPSEPYSPERLAAARAEGRPVFVNFTAAWCVTCQVNERAALSSPAVAEAFRSHHVDYLVGDWTNRDAVIAQALAEHGRDGVPLYLVYPAGGGESRVLPQLLTEGAVIEAVTQASARN